MAGIFDTRIEFLKGIGPQRASILQKELGIHTYGDLIQYYPFRYNDKTRIYTINEITEDSQFIQLKGYLGTPELIGTGHKKRLTIPFKDSTGTIELIWFQGIQWVLSKLKPEAEYRIFGKPARYGFKITIAHPELESLQEETEGSLAFQPVYPLTEGLKSKRIENKALGKWMSELLKLVGAHIRETLPEMIIRRRNLISKAQAIEAIHFPKNQQALIDAQRRLKYEELFFIQLRLLKSKTTRKQKLKGQVFADTKLLNRFYEEFLPFPLTNAQKRVVREIFTDLKSGQQMNRLVQGDVGSGKTIVAFLAALIVASSGGQIALMAPTEILAQQHFHGLKRYADLIGLPMALLTGSVKKSARKEIHEKLESGETKILVGTHALLEDEVTFQNLGLAIIDEQHRFGVAQRSKLWRKNVAFIPHVLVMTATPIPRTLAMTLYGDLDISIIDELPAGRKPIKTVHRYDSHRLEVNGFLKRQLTEGRQIYIVYPLIDESEKLDLKHLMDGYESICRAFPDQPISILHGKMKPDAKEYEMGRFKKGETTIMVATTVIEVGVDVPNATVIVIENAERFGMSQLHQLRGRVGRGGNQSFCILMTNDALSTDSKTRIQTLVNSTDGFEIAEADLRLRGPGDLEGTRQSGALDLLIADLSKDAELMKESRNDAEEILSVDPELLLPQNAPILLQVKSMKKGVVNWSRIS